MSIENKKENGKISMNKIVLFSLFHLLGTLFVALRLKVCDIRDENFAI